MSYITPVSRTTPTLELLTRPNILKRFVEETNFGLHGTATGGSTSTVVDTGLLQSTGYSHTELEGAWVRMSTGASAGDVRNITTYAPSSGTITASPNFSSTGPASSHVYTIFKYMRPGTVLNFIDTICTEECFLPTWDYLTEADDGDMEQSHTTAWTATNSTVTKSTTEPLLGGKRVLSVAATATDGYASQDFFCEPTASYHISVDFRCNSATTTTSLVVYDVTNSAVIQTVSLGTRQQWVKGRVTNFQTPAGCYRFQVRLVVHTNATTVFYKNLVVYPHGARTIAGPWWAKDESYVKGIFRLREETLRGSQHLLSSEMTGSLERGWEPVNSGFGTGQLRYQSRPGHGSIDQPLFVFGVRPEIAYASDTETKHINSAFMHWALCEKAFTSIAATPGIGQLNDKWVQTMATKATVEARKHRIRQAKELADAITAPVAWRNHTRSA